MFEFPATLISDHDGDTARFAVNPFPKGVAGDVRYTFSVRFFGIDCPELSTEHGKAVAAIVAERLANVPLILQVVKADKYGSRVDGVIFRDGVNFNDWLVEQGHAKPYDGRGPKPDWSDAGPLVASRLMMSAGYLAGD